MISFYRIPIAVYFNFAHVWSHSMDSKHVAHVWSHLLMCTSLLDNLQQFMTMQFLLKSTSWVRSSHELVQEKNHVYEADTMSTQDITESVHVYVHLRVRKLASLSLRHNADMTHKSTGRFWNSMSYTSSWCQCQLNTSDMSSASAGYLRHYVSISSICHEMTSQWRRQRCQIRLTMISWLAMDAEALCQDVHRRRWLQIPPITGRRLYMPAFHFLFSRAFQSLL